MRRTAWTVAASVVAVAGLVVAIMTAPGLEGVRDALASPAGLFYLAGALMLLVAVHHLRRRGGTASSATAPARISRYAEGEAWHQEAWRESA